MSEKLYIKQKDKEMLSMIAEGMTSEEIAHVAHISTHGVDTRVDKLKQLLDARNKAHLVSLAYKGGHITIDKKITYFQAKMIKDNEAKKTAREDEIENMIEKHLEKIWQKYKAEELPFFRELIRKIYENVNLNIYETSDNSNGWDLHV